MSVCIYEREGRNRKKKERKVKKERERSKKRSREKKGARKGCEEAKVLEKEK